MSVQGNMNMGVVGDVHESNFGIDNAWHVLCPNNLTG